MAPAAWRAVACGREPQAPLVEQSSVAGYNASIDRVAAYDKVARSYNACVSHEAVAAQTLISDDARQRMSAISAAAAAVQGRIAGNFSTLSAQLAAAGQNLGSGRNRPPRR